jgi:hypothetical protein
MKPLIGDPFARFILFSSYFAEQAEQILIDELVFGPKRPVDR